MFFFFFFFGFFFQIFLRLLFELYILVVSNNIQNKTMLILNQHSKAIFLSGFYLFYVLESIFVLFEPYVRFHSLS